MIFTDETANALYATVLAQPDNDLARLVLADRLEEIGQAERAEFIRLQIETAETKDMRLWELMFKSKGWFPNICKATGNLENDWGVCHDGSVHYDGKYRRAEFWVRRGLPAEVRAPLDWLRGGECENCGGCCHESAYCPTGCGGCCTTCHGAGRTPGHLRELVRRWPITRVVVTDREPESFTPSHGEPNWSWYSEGMADDPATLPDAVFDPLSGWQPSMTGCTIRRVFPTREVAITALSDAMLQEAREEQA